MLITRNVRINRHRTSLRFEKELWEALEEICAREKVTISNLCAHIDSTKGTISRSAAVRHYALGYFRDAATDEGHYGAGHGWISANGNSLTGDRSVVKQQDVKAKETAMLQQLKTASKVLSS